MTALQVCHTPFWLMSGDVLPVLLGDQVGRIPELAAAMMSAPSPASRIA
jgi:hypothetical protein